MKLAISNIAWAKEEEEEIAARLAKLGIKHVEIAPTKYWDNPLEANKTQINSCLKFWQKFGIEVVAFQSLLYGRPDLAIFDETKREETQHYLNGIIKLGAKMGVKILVFGSPKNRLVNGLGQDQIKKIAASFFWQIGEKAYNNKMFFCIEPNPSEYSCDFITTVKEGINLVKEVENPGFALHLDTGQLTLAKEPVEKILPEALPLIKHVHLSEPFLEDVGEGSVDFAKIIGILKKYNYQNFVSIEMKAKEPGTNLARVEKSIKFCQYFIST